MKVKSYRDLVAWKKDMELSTLIYEITATFPRSEQFGLTNQGRRASTSIPSNIAEGHSQQPTRDFVNFLYTARGSLAEVETRIDLAARLQFLEKHTATPCLTKAAEVGRLINGLIQSLRKYVK